MAERAGGRHVVVVASYNIHQCVGVDGRRDPERIAAVIQQLGADVIALQEVDSWPGEDGESEQMEFLAHGTGFHAVSGPTVERVGARFGNVLLTRLPLLDVRRIDLSHRRREPRGAIDAELAASPPRRLRVIATHLGLLPRERREQVQRILERVEHDERSSPVSVTVLLGDINEWLVFGRPLRWLHARFGHAPGGRSWPAWWPLFALDRIWVRPAAALRGFLVHATPLSRRASDHLPVVAEVALSPGGLD